MQIQNKKSLEQQENFLAPAVVKEQEIDILVAKCKRIRISSKYMKDVEIQQQQDSEGVYQGDLVEQLKNEGTKQSQTSNKVEKVREGKGIQLFMNGDMYNGDWKNNKMDGYGSYFNEQENYFYNGQFKDGQLTGRGIIFYCSSQDYYMGEVKNGKQNGKGLFYRRQENMYELSEYSEGKIVKTIKSGEGKPQSLEITKELIQDQQFIDIYIRPKDFFFEHYEGDLINGKKEGNGIMFNKDGSRYEGTWKHNKPNGLGVNVYPDQKFAMGEYKGGLLNGFGRSQFHSKDIYRGYFYQGRMQGLGLYLYYDTQEWVFGYFKNNSLDQEFQKGKLLKHQGTLPNFGALENKYKDFVNKETYEMDIQFIEQQIQTSEQRKRKSGSNTKDNTIINESRKKILSLTVQEQVKKQYMDNQGSNYCTIF